jgi:hypothetical protein
MYDREPWTARLPARRHFIWKLWQSVHSTWVGLVSWVPTWMVFRPQWSVSWQWFAQLLTVHLMLWLGVQAQPLLVQS